VACRVSVVSEVRTIEVAVVSRAGSNGAGASIMSTVELSFVIPAEVVVGSA
jgi:hypothetical protein